MEIVTIRTTQNIDIDYEIGGIGERTLGRLIDLVLFIPVFIVLLLVVASMQTTGIWVSLFVFLGLFAFYDLACEVFFNGQSIGKRVMKLRVISLDGGRPTFSQYLLRWLFRIVDFSISGQLCALICAVSSTKCQRLGDIVAGTVVIRTVPRTAMNNIIFENVENAYQPVFPEVTQLSDKDISLIHEVIQTYFKTANSVVVYNMAEKVKGKLMVNTPPGMNNLQFLQTIVRDYSHINAQAGIF